MGDIYNGLIEKAYMQQEIVNDKVKRYVTIIIPDEPKVINYERAQSPEFWLDKVSGLFDHKGNLIKNTICMASHENPTRTPSAGSISMITDPDTAKTYVAMPQKDAGAPRDPGFRVPRNGYPRCKDDWYTMDHLIAETFEEGLFVTKDRNELILSGNPVYDNIIISVAENLEKNTNIRFKGTINAKMYLQGCNDELYIMDSKENERNMVKGAISWTPETGFNIIKRLNLIYPLSNLLFVDGETFPNGKPIKRDYCCIDLDGLAGKRFGDMITETVYQHTAEGKIRIFDREERFYTDKVPRSFLCQIEHDGRPVYPIDWLCESREFLSREQTLRSHNGLGKFSTFEKDQFEKANIKK